MAITQWDLDYAFNRGCDAFIRGEGFEDNPYLILTPMYGLWQDGWLDCRDHFATDPRSESRTELLRRHRANGQHELPPGSKGVKRRGATKRERGLRASD